MENRDKVCLISGRFDRPHCGHLKTLTDLARRYKRVLVVVLDHPDQMYPVCYRTQILREILDNCTGEYEVVVNQYHFGQISIDELLKFDFDVYAAGNLEVLAHIEKIRDTCPRSARGAEKHFDIIWTDRPYEYTSSTERLGRKVEEMQ